MRWNVSDETEATQLNVDDDGELGHMSLSVGTQREAWVNRAPRSRTLAYLPASAFIVDLFMISISALLAGLIRQRWQPFETVTGILDTMPMTVLAAGPAIVLIWMLCLVFAGGYTASRFEVGTDEFRRVGTASIGTAGIVGVACYLVEYPLSRGFFFLTFAFGTVALFVGRLALRRAVHKARSLGGLQHNVLIVGSRAGVDEIALVLAREKRLGYQVVGCLTPTDDQEPETERGVPVLGNCSAVTESVVASGADVVFFANGGLTSAVQMRRIAWDLEHHDVQVVVAPSISEVSGHRVRIRPVGGLPLIHLDPPRSTDAARWGKRLLDIAGSLGLLVLVWPILVFAAIRIKLHDGGPVLFRQTRTGRNGEEFSLIKFRTMVVDAETQLADLHAQVGFEGGLFKMEQDPRITKPGQLAATLLHRRAPAAGQRAARRDEPGRPAPAASRRGRSL